MPNLLSLNNYYYRRGGSDVVMFEHDDLFSSLGWDTAIFSMQHRSNEPSEWDKYFISELEYGEDYSFLQKLSMAAKIVYSLEARKNLSDLLTVFKPDIAHAHCIYHHLSPSVLSLLHERGIPTVITAHELKLACPAYKMFNDNGVCEECKGGNLLHVIKNRCIYNSLLTSTMVAIESGVHRLFGLYRKNLDRVVTPSLFFRDKLAEWGWPMEKLVYIPNFIRADEHIPRYEAGKYFLYFGRLAPEKGVITLMQAALQVGARLRIVGTGPSEQELKSLVPAGANIEFMDYCSGETLWEHIRGARAVILPSEWYENAPISILEAYANGKPVIGARIGGIPEMLKDGETGYLFKSGNTEELAERMAKMQAMPDTEIAAMGKAARDYVGSTFTPQRYLGDMLDLYKSLGVAVSDSAIHKKSKKSIY